MQLTDLFQSSSARSETLSDPLFQLYQFIARITSTLNSIRTTRNLCKNFPKSVSFTKDAASILYQTYTKKKPISSVFIKKEKRRFVLMLAKFSTSLVTYIIIFVDFNKLLLA